MLLFKAEHVQFILDGRKTQTRRTWAKCRVKVGSVHKCYSGGLPISRCPECRGKGTVDVETGYEVNTCPGCKGTGLLQPFASVRIKRVWLQTIENMTPEDLQAELCETTLEYLEVFCRANSIKLANSQELQAWRSQVLWAVEFEVVR